MHSKNASGSEGNFFSNVRTSKTANFLFACLFFLSLCSPFPALSMVNSLLIRKQKYNLLLLPLPGEI